ncbi:MAG TPA: helix-turn-helix domain-containing protein [Spirochaetia bacterium]|nr:helix-turn-helix domain-containing protein [Spirochaetia bacterium]
MRSGVRLEGGRKSTFFPWFLVNTVILSLLLALNLLMRYRPLTALPVTSLQTLAIVGLGVCLLADGLMAYAFSRANHRRISEVARQMVRLAGIRTGNGNQYTILREAVRATLSWKAKLDLDLCQGTAAMRQDFLRRLARGHWTGAAEVERAFAQFGIVPLSSCYAVFVVRPRSPLDRVTPAHDTGRKLASFIIASAVEAILNRLQCGFVAEHDGSLVCIVSLRLLSALEWNRDLDTIIADTRTYLQETFGLRTIVGVSTLVNGVQRIPQAFREALSALEYGPVVEPESVIRYGDVRNRQSTCRRSLETDEQLGNAVRLGDEEKTAEILRLIMDQNLRGADVSIQSLKCFIFDMYNLLSQAIATVDEPRQRELARAIQPLMRALEGDSSLAALEAEVQGVVLAVCGSLRSVRKDNGLALEIRRHVEANYTDLNLSIGAIADRFDLSQGYLTRLFRERTGQSLLDFITGVRISHAKELISKQHRSLEDVAGAVGYLSASALIRAFKRHEGVAPGRYRYAGG